MDFTCSRDILNFAFYLLQECEINVRNDLKSCKIFFFNGQHLLFRHIFLSYQIIFKRIASLAGTIYLYKHASRQQITKKLKILTIFENVDDEICQDTNFVHLIF